uniref:Lysosomal protein NCU-G1 n=1 Tax=Clastoptera arizonana TaxID=38151 RepID=A0A1B6E8L9_9HEMI
MKIFKIIPFFCAFILLGLRETAANRQLSYKVNPDCQLPQCNNSSIILIHVKAVGEKDVLHHIWDFSGKPSVMLAVTSPNTSIEIDWDNFIFGMADSVKINPRPTYTYSVVLDEIIEFNDEDDKGNLPNNNANSSYITTIDTKDISWRISEQVNDTDKVHFTVEGGFPESIKKNGTIQITMSAFASYGHEEPLPRLLHSGNASQVDIVLNKLTTLYPKSRFGIHLIAASTDDLNATVAVKARQTLDDEHAPGVFNVVEVLTPKAVAEDTLGGYLQWRPVVYTSPERDMTNSTESIQYSAPNLRNPIEALNCTLLYCVFGNLLSEMLVVESNVTFGVAHDGFYKNNYAAWTFLVGYGHPPVEKFSMLVTLVLSIGLGLPALLIVVGGACIFIRRLSRNNENLFLGR